MANVFYLTGTTSMVEHDMVRTLVNAGFTKQQSLALASIILGFREKTVSAAEGETYLVTNGFRPETAQDLSQKIYSALANAA